MTLADDLVQRDETESDLIAIERDGEGLALDRISRNVVSSTLEPVEFLADADVEVGSNIASGQFGEVVQVRTTSANPNLPANAVFAMKRPLIGAKEAYDVEYEVMKMVENCGHLVGVVAYQREIDDADNGSRGTVKAKSGKVEAEDTTANKSKESGNIVCLLMPLFDSSLSLVLKSRFESLDVLSWFSAKEITDWLLQISHGMRYLHAKGYVHLDLKTRNVMVRFRGSRTVESLAVGDFGEAIFVGSTIDANENNHGRATETSAARIAAGLNHPRGSRGHQAPEVLAASYVSPLRGRALFPADVFSFGIVASVCVSGIAVGEMLGDEWRAPRSGSSVRPPADDSAEWSELRGIVSWCLETNGSDRPTFEDLAETDLQLPSPERSAVSAEEVECARREKGTRTGRKDWKQRALRAEDEIVRVRDHATKAEAEAQHLRDRVAIAVAEADTLRERARSAEERAERAEEELRHALERLATATQ